MTQPVFLGIEIGGTKLQLGVGAGDGSPFVELIRRDVQLERGGAGIREQIAEAGRLLSSKHSLQRVGIGFGGPVFASRGIVQLSHQVLGWENFPLTEWCQQTLGLPAVMANDCDVAGLAEAKFGAGRGRQSLFYVTVGTGIGGGLVLGGKIHGLDRPAAAEIGHLRYGLECVSPHDTIESRAAGPAISQAVRDVLSREMSRPNPSAAARELLQLSSGNNADEKLRQLSTRDIGTAAENGNEIAVAAFRQAANVLGWGLAQVVTLLAPEILVVGGGVSLVSEELFMNPLRTAIAKYVFPPLKETVLLSRAELGESVVVHGALALAASSVD